MSKLNSQKSVKKTDEVPEIEPPKKKVKVVEEVPEVEDNEILEDHEVEEEDDEDENGDAPVMSDDAKEKAEHLIEQGKKAEQISQQRAEEIQILQNDGVYRTEMLFQLGQLNQNIVDLNTLIAGVIENAKK